MTAPARAPQPTTQTTVDLIDAVIARTLETSDARKRIGSFTHGQPYNRITAQVREAMIKVPQLMEADPDTLVDAVVTIQRQQLEIGVTAFLVPYRDKRRNRIVVNAVTGYKGKVELLISNHIVRDVDPHCVYSKEHFVYEQGLNPRLEHHPLAPAQRGHLIGAYAIAWLTRSHAKFKFLYLDEIEAVREEFSKQWNREKVGECPPWYARKTAVNAVVALLPMTQKLRDVLAQTSDDQFFAESTRGALNVVPRDVSDMVEDTEDEGSGRGEHDTQEEANGNARVAGPSGPPASDSARECPKCGGGMWDNRVGKKNPKAPDWKCKDKSCDGVIWPPRGNSSNTQGDLPMDVPERKAPDALAQG